MGTDPGLGKILHGVVGVDRFELARVNVLDERAAAAQTLKAFLGCLEFTIAAGDDGLVNVFTLSEVFEEWPDPNVELPTPCASIIVPGNPGHAEHNFVPSALDETWGKFGPGTVLWKTGEVEIDFQVDVWLETAAARTAVAARLPSAFNPYERAGGVILQGPLAYFSWPLRFTLMALRRFDSEETTEARERRIMATIRADVPTLQLRKGVELVPQILPPGELEP